MVWVFIAASFLAAGLLFAVQPFAARQVLPVFGGSPAVWNTAMMFFQIGLLAGYCYAHVLSTRLPGRAQLTVHAVVLIAAVLAPLGVETSAIDASGAGTGRLLLLLAQGVAVPFFCVATAGPLLQRWFASTGHPSADDPYFLYAAGNAGSFTGLLAYPFVVERVWSLPEQAAWWRGGLVVFAVLCLVCGWLGLGRRPAARPEPEPAPPEPVAWRTRLWWVFLAFIPSSLMLGVTQFLTVDLAAVPLLWVLPLGIYLLTFVAAFSRWGGAVTRAAGKVWPFAVAGVVLAFLLAARQPIVAIMALHLALLAAAGCLCHGRLRESRPGVSRLTEFYLWLAIGGALGGVFNSLAAPVLFNDLHEYPIAIVLASLALPAAAPAGKARRLSSALWLVPIALLLWVWLGPKPHTAEAEAGPQGTLLLIAGVPVLAAFLLSKRRGLFTAATAALLLGATLRGDGSRVELRERSFFGVHTVRIDEAGRFRVLGHGTTVHGLAWLDATRRLEPLTYYHRKGPAGQVFEQFGDGFDDAALIGLGAGSLASYGQPGQRFEFYEIDPTVVRIASDPEFFAFVDASPADVGFRVGDGRLLLAGAEGERYDVIVLDAFSSDAVPVHLLTREAFEIYRSRLAPDGMLLVHLSNLHLRLGPFVAAAMRDLGLTALERMDYRTSDQQAEHGEYTSHWFVAAADPGVLAPLAGDFRWETPEPAPQAWTDLHADLVAALLAE